MLGAIALSFATSGCVAPQEPAPPSRPKAVLTAAETFVSERVDPERCRTHLWTLTREAHLAGTPADRRTVEYVERTLRDAGFETSISEYHVLLSWPVRTALTILGPKPAELDLREQPDRVFADEALRRACTAYHGYSPSGRVEGEIVFANYGTEADFARLAELGIPVRGKVCLVRYGGQYRGLKVQEAERNGAVGVLVYSDPEDDGWRQGDVIPDGPWRPERALQRGSVQFISTQVGDPLTPGRPATKDAVRLERSEAKCLPKIPSLPISAHCATELFRQLRGANVQKDWQGSCPVAYHTGPGPVSVRLEVELDEQVRPIWNVHGKLRGSDPSGRYVLIGNHRDSWVHGAIDPSSGSAVTLETMTVLGALVKSGWQPRLGIHYASWDGEEQGLLGSTEWVEEHATAISAQCLAYFNGDAMVSGSRLDASATPDLVELLAEAAERVDAPDGKGRWLVRWAHGGRRPPVGHLGSGSDYTAFLCRAGISCLDLSARGGHGVYHSVHDDALTLERFIDPDFAIHAALARMLAIATVRFASPAVAPLDTKAWAPWLESAIAAQHGLPKADEDRLTLAVKRLAECDLAKSDAHHIALHAALIDSAGLKSRPWYQNLLVAPGRKLGYGAVMLPGITEALESNDMTTVALEVDRLIRVVDKMSESITGAAAVKASERK